MSMVIGLMAALGAGLIVNLIPLSTAGPLWVLAFFICIYGFVAVAVFWCIVLLRRLLMTVLRVGALRRAVEDSSEDKLYYYASFVALLPVIYLGMQSIGRVGVMEVILLAAFGMIGCFYIAKRY